jgi:hypothetical protein
MIGLGAALMNEPRVRKESGAEVCPADWNCSYVLSFTAPGYNCTELASGVDSEVKALGTITPPFNTSIFAPIGNLTYFADTDIGQYKTSQIDSDLWGRPKQYPPYPRNLGAFRTEPVMWIGYCTVDDYSKLQPFAPGKGDWYNAYTPVIIGCEHYEVNYTVQFDWVGKTQSHKVLHRDYLRKVINTTFTPKLDSDKRLKDRTSAVPEGNYVLPTDVEQYRLTAAYHSIGFTLRHILRGWTRLPQRSVRSEIGTTPLVDRLNYLPIKDFSTAIREMYENMIISLLSDPTFIVVSWASSGQPTGLAKSDPSSKRYPCRKTRRINVLKYDKVKLLSVYGASIALAIAAILLGIHAYWEEGEMRDMKPSSIIEASKASHLQILGKGREVKIGYGMVHEEAGKSVRSFGVEGNLAQPGRQWY